MFDETKSSKTKGPSFTPCSLVQTAATRKNLYSPAQGWCREGLRILFSRFFCKRAQ